MTPTDKRSTDAGPLSFLVGGGEMGERARAFDWSATPLSAPQSWPQGLQAAVSICLNSRFPIVLWWGPELRLIYNDAWRPVLGQTKHPQALGSPGRQVWPEIWHIIGPMLEGVLADGKATWSDDQLLPLDRNGYLEEAYFTYSYSPILGDGGKVGGVFAAVNETTQRVIGERRLKTLRGLAAQAALAKSADEACRAVVTTLAANPSDVPFALLYLLGDDQRQARLCGATGLPPEHPARPPILPLAGGDTHGAWPLASVFGSGQMLVDLGSRHGQMPTQAWPVPPRQAVLLPLRSSGQDRRVGVLILGVHPGRELDDEHRGFHDLVAGHVATAIANARAYEEERRRAEALAELDRAKTAFFSNVSHEFRTPLTLILGPVEDALAETDGALPPSQRERLEVVHRNGLRLKKLVNTLLDFSRIEAGRVQASYEPTDLASFTADLASSFRSACERAGLELAVDCPPCAGPVYVDQEMWEKVVLNLVSNAFKYTLKGRIAVSLRQDGRAVELAVRDTGTGIPPDQMPHLFERFHRVEGARGRTQEGSGIGLALVRELARLHGGDVRAESELGKGTVFTVTVPLGTAHLPQDRIKAPRALGSTALAATAYVQEALRWLPDSAEELPARPDLEDAADAPRPLATGERPRILLADDNADMRDYIRRLLAGPYDVTAVADGLGAREAARRRPPDLLLSDVMMPGLDGFGLLRELRADPRTQGLPVILLSARAGEGARVEGLRAGADDYLTKPFSAKELLARIASALEIARLRREALDRERRLLAEVEEQRNWLRVTLASIGDAVIATDTQGRATFLNPVAERLTGWPQAEAQGRPLETVFAILHERTRQPVESPVERVLREGVVVGLGNHTVLIARDGTERPIDDAAAPIRDAGGRVIGVVLIFRDVTEQRRTERQVRQSEARKSAILETALDCIITMDHEGKVVEFNPAAEKTFGYSRKQVVGRQLADFIIPPSLRERHHRGMAHYLATGEGPVLGRRLELPALRADGTEFPVELAITRIPTEGPPLFTAYLRDIGERQRAEQHRNVRLAVTQALAQSEDVDAVAGDVLQAVGDGLGWDVGFFWTVNAGQDALVCRKSWQRPDMPETEFETASCRRTFRRGEGLPGHVWSTGQPAWVLDVLRDGNFPRVAPAARDALHSAFACPVVVGDRMLGVIEFFCQRIREPDAGLLEMMATVTGQLGQFVERRQAESDLRRSEERFRSLMDQAPFSIQVFSPDGRTSRVNRAWEELWGVTLERIADYNILEDRQLEAKGVLPSIRRAFAGEPAFVPAIRYDPNETIPDRTKHADPVRWVAAVAYPLKDDAGRVREVVLVHQDITGERRAEAALRESEEKLRLLADTIPQLAWMARPDGHIFWYNRRWYEYTGTTPEEMEGWGWQSVHDPAALPRVLERWKGSIASGEPFDMVFPLKGADGQFRPFLTRVNPLRDEKGRILYWFGTNTDISEIKRMEEALREADRRKDEFLATLAHELRNPLAPIRNSLQILKMPRVDAATAQQTRDMMERQVHHLVRLVDDLLDVSRVMRGKIELRREPVELATVVARAVETAKPLIEVQGHHLDLSLPGESLLLDADPVRLAQVVGNLLTNSAKYTEGNGHIWLTARRECGEAVLSVRDSGIGIAPDLLPHVFELFVQADHAATRSQGGLGIGLTLVKNLVEMHGGTVEARSAGLGKGCEFVVRLPLTVHQGQQPPDESGERPQESPPSGHRLLVVDDNEDAANSLAMLLRLQGHEVRVAHDGPSALEVATSYRPDLVFLDIGMPGMDGYEVARRLRKTPGLEKVVLAALTGWGQQEDRRRTAEAGFNHHLVKPPEPQALERLLAELKVPGG